MKPIAIITARGGSKRIPKKNIKKFLGKPIIAYSIRACLKSKVFSHVIISTDDNSIAKVAKKLGAEVPFMRSKKNASDTASTDDVILEVIRDLDKRDMHAQYYCVLYPTAPFITAQQIKKMNRQFSSSRSDTMMTIAPFSYPVQRSLRIKKGHVEFWQPKYKNYRSQELEKLYHDAGQAYWVRRKTFLKSKSVFTKKTSAFILPADSVQDIDTMEDWKIAERKMKMIRSKI